MKPILLAAALMISGAAIAQQTMPANQDANTSTGVNPTTSSTMPNAASPPMDPAMPTSPTTATDPSMASPAPTNGAMSSGMSSGMSTGSDNYPVCSRSVTDRCVQSGKMTKPMMRRKK